MRYKLYSVDLSERRVEICMNELAGVTVPFWVIDTSSRSVRDWPLFRFLFISFSQFAKRGHSLRLRSGRIPTVGEGKLHFLAVT